MSRFQLLPRNSYVAMPWKNGGGTTHEIARHPAEGDEFAWRLSIADVTSSGPFSRFPSIDRWTVVIEGAGMKLLRAEGVIDLLPLRPFFFDGDSETSGELTSGSVRDLNLMVRRGWAEASLSVIGLTATPLPVAVKRGVTFLHSLGPIGIRSGARFIEVGGGETLRIDADEESDLIEMIGESGAAVVEAFLHASGAGMTS